LKEEIMNSSIPIQKKKVKVILYNPKDCTLAFTTSNDEKRIFRLTGFNVVPQAELKKEDMNLIIENNNILKWGTQYNSCDYNKVVTFVLEVDNLNDGDRISFGKYVSIPTQNFLFEVTSENGTEIYYEKTTISENGASSYKLHL
jgi:hypothetical protein